MTALLLLVGLAVAGTATDDRGTSVTVGPAPRVVALGAASGETVALLGRADTVVAADVGHRLVPALATKAVLNYHQQVSAEGVLAQSPDLVLASPSTGPEASLQQIEAAGVPVFVAPEGFAVADVKARIAALGALLDAQEAASALLERLEADLARAAVRRSRLAGKTALFVYARGAGTLMVAGQETSAHAVLSLAGVDNAVSGHEGYLPLTAEAAIAAAPDVLVLTTHGLDSLGGVEAVRSLPGVLQLGDVPIVTGEDLLLLGLGPRTGEGVLALQDAIEEAVP